MATIFRYIRSRLLFVARPAIALVLASMLTSSMAAPLPVTISWIGNSLGYANKQWVQNDMRAIAVAPDGTVYTNARWDEGGGEIGKYRDGKLIFFAEGTHGWGNGGGDAIAVNSHYLFAAADIENERGHLQRLGNWPAAGLTWFGVTRRNLSNIKTATPFDGGVGNLGSPLANAFLVVDATSDPDSYVRGVAATDKVLYVSDYKKNVVITYDADSMQRRQVWSVASPGRLTLSTDQKSLWVISGADGERKRVLEFSASGKQIGELSSLPLDADPADLTMQPSGDLLVADNGPHQQVLVFGRTGAGMILKSRLGEDGGVLASPAGAVGPLRFDGLTGVGSDAQGNIYLATNGGGPRPLPFIGAQLRSLAPNGSLRWELNGLMFIDGADVDPEYPATLYTGSKMFTLDFSKDGAGLEARYVGNTANRFAAPNDQAFQSGRGVRGTPMIRRLGGKRFLFTVDMNGMQLAVYKFKSKDGPGIAYPTALFRRNGTPPGQWPEQSPHNTGWLWRDSNGDGKLQENEFEPASGPPDTDAGNGWWVDRSGDIWEARGSAGIRHLAFGGLDSFGGPIYHLATARDIAPPRPFTSVRRLIYLSDSDTMYVSGYSDVFPVDRRFWKEGGRLLVRYDHWSSADRHERYRIALPWDADAKTAIVTIGVAVAGNYIFTVDGRTATVSVYRAADGKFAGTMAPGPEIGSASGWVDVVQGINAYHRANDEYLVFVEDDLHAKVIMYRWRPQAND